MNLEAGQIVRVRSRQYLVEDVVPGLSAEEDTLVRLSCVDDDALGESLERRSSNDGERVVGYCEWVDESSRMWSTIDEDCQ